MQIFFIFQPHGSTADLLRRTRSSRLPRSSSSNSRHRSSESILVPKNPVEGPEDGRVRFGWAHEIKRCPGPNHFIPGPSKRCLWLSSLAVKGCPLTTPTGGPGLVGPWRPIPLASQWRAVGVSPRSAESKGERQVTTSPWPFKTGGRQRMRMRGR